MANVEGLRGDFRSRLEAMVKASGGKITITSGYRSEEEQATLWARALKKYGSEAAARKWVAPPGKSNHGRGVAVDLGGDLALAHRLAPQFGLTFPMGHEPWHVEPLGYRSSPDAYTTPPGVEDGFSEMSGADASGTDPMAAFARLIESGPAEGLGGIEQMSEAVTTGVM